MNYKVQENDHIWIKNVTSFIDFPNEKILGSIQQLKVDTFNMFLLNKKVKIR